MKNIIFLFVGLVFLTALNVSAFDTGQVDIHGFVSQGYLQTNHNNYLAETEDGSFEFNELAINFSTPVKENLRIGMQFFARDLGAEGNDEITLDWAYADYSWRDELGLRIGKVKFDSGLFNESRDLDFNRTSVLLPQSIYMELWRDAQSSIKGATLYGNIGAGLVGSFAYTFQVGLPPFSKETGLAGAFESSFSNYNLTITNITSDITVNGKVLWHTPLEGLLTSVTAYNISGVKINGTLDVLPYFDYKVTRWLGYTFSAKYETEKLNIVGELYKGDFKGEWDLGLGYEERAPLPSIGWYTSVSYQFLEFFRLGLTYSDLCPDTNNKDGKDTYSADKMYNVMAGNVGQPKLAHDFEAWHRATTLSTRFDIGYSWIIKLEATYNDGFGVYSSASNEDLERYWMLYAAKMTFIF